MNSPKIRKVSQLCYFSNACANMWFWESPPPQPSTHTHQYHQRNKLNITHWWILLVQFLLLRKEIQTVPEWDFPSGPSFGDRQRQITEDIKGVGVVGADGAMERAAQLAWEKVCTRRAVEAVSGCHEWASKKVTRHVFLTYYLAVISLQVLLPHRCRFLWKPDGLGWGRNMWGC